MSFWISDSFTENNLCEVVRGVAGDLVEEVNITVDIFYPNCCMEPSSLFQFKLLAFLGFHLSVFLDSLNPINHTALSDLFISFVMSR